MLQGEDDTSVSTIAPPIKFGRDYGLYNGVGISSVGSYTTPTFDDCGECSE